MNEIPGVAVPADDPTAGSPTPFPWDSAATVIGEAQKVGDTFAAELVREVRDWLGHPEVVTALSEKWSPQAQSTIMDSLTEFASARADLAAYWEGPAYDAYVIYSDALKDVADETARIMGEMSTLVRSFRDEIGKTFQAAIEAIGQTASDLIRAASTFAYNWASFWGAVAGAVLEILAVFVETVTKLASEAVGIMYGYVNDVGELKKQAAALPVPGSAPGAIGNVDGWDVRPQS